MSTTTERAQGAFEPNILAFQNADVLALLDDKPDGQLTKAALAEATGRDKSNLGKTLQRLVDDGLLQNDPTAGLTDAGRAQLAAYRRARHGGEKRRVRGQWPLDKFRPNPMNRPVRREALPEMAASMRGPAGLVQRVMATEPDANGVRMLIDGEHRWEAAKLVLNQAFEEGQDLPDWLADGLPFEEGQADPATALIITLVANARRADMSPWDDARQLLKLQQATDWSASELARQIGRVKDGERSGLRDVQSKLKIAREATPEAVAEYERTGSWDALRDSVTTPKAPTLTEQVAESGAAVFGEGKGPETDNPLSPYAELAMVEVAWAMSFLPFKADGRELAVLTDGYLYQCRALGDLVQSSHIDYDAFDLPNGRACVVRPTEKGWRWVQDRFAGGKPNLGQLIAFRDRVGLEPGRRQPGHVDDEGMFTSALNTRETRKRLLAPSPAKPTPRGPHVVNGVDYGNATRANEARRAVGILPPLPAPNYGSPSRPTGAHSEDDQPSVKLDQDQPAAATRDPEPSIPLGQVLQNMADEANEQKRHGLRATLEVLVERLEPVLTILNGERTEDGFVQIESDEADWFVTELSEAVRWAEDAIAVTGAFDPLPGDDIARPDIGSPAVPIRKSIHPDYIVCLEDGRKFKSLKRHLRTRYDMSPDEYRAKWKLPADYPMVAPSYAQAREDLARRMGLRTGAAR